MITFFRKRAYDKSSFHRNFDQEQYHSYFPSNVSWFREGTKNKRPVVDFRLLNTRIMRRNTAIPLLRDIFKMLGRSKCEVLSCVDLKDAFHSLGLTDKAKEFCGILPYFGSPHYRYEVLPMGLSVSPSDG